jgi:hypothetical protein
MGWLLAVLIMLALIIFAWMCWDVFVWLEKRSKTPPCELPQRVMIMPTSPPPEQVVIVRHIVVVRREPPP